LNIGHPLCFEPIFAEMKEGWSHTVFGIWISGQQHNTNARRGRVEIVEPAEIIMGGKPVIAEPTSELKKAIARHGWTFPLMANIKFFYYSGGRKEYSWTNCDFAWC